MTVKQISVFLENKPAKLAQIAAILSQNEINLRAMSLADAQDFGIVRLIADDIYNASTILKDNGFVITVKDVLAIQVEDKPGSLTKILKILGDNDINMEYMYAFTSHDTGCASFIMKVNDEKKAVEVLQKNQARLLSQEEL